jgi:hypothetical protein
MVPAQTLVPEATWLHCARSADNGASFFADTKVVINNHSGLACSMCMTRARFGIDGKIYLVFRSAKDNIRDFYVLKGDALGGDFTAIRVNNDNWNINYCPMVGPELEIGNGGRQFCAFMSKGHVYWAVSNSDFTRFTQHVATPLNEVDELYPTAITNKSGQVLFVWQVGRMSVSGSAIVKWALYNSDGTYTGNQGVVGKTFSGTRATAFVGTNNNFYIVYNAEKLASKDHIQDNSNVSVSANRVNDVLKIPTIAGLKQ